jgi:hypothetical protein
VSDAGPVGLTDRLFEGLERGTRSRAADVDAEHPAAAIAFAGLPAAGCDTLHGLSLGEQVPPETAYRSEITISEITCKLCMVIEYYFQSHIPGAVCVTEFSMRRHL